MAPYTLPLLLSDDDTKVLFQSGNSFCLRRTGLDDRGLLAQVLLDQPIHEHSLPVNFVILSQELDY